MNSSNNKLNWQFCERVQFKENWLKLNLIWREKNGREEIQNLRCMARNASSNLNDINNDMQVHGQIKHKGKTIFVEKLSRYQA